MIHRLRRKLSLDIILLGVALTLSVMAADHYRLLTTLENWAYDKRALTCQFFTPPPTDKLVHLDIDDRALDVIGKWPWPMAKFADMIDELRLAGPKVVAMDIIFDEPQGLTWTATDPKKPKENLRMDDNDAEFAAALRRLNCAVLPAALIGDLSALSPLASAIYAEVKQNLEITDAELMPRLRAKGFAKADIADQMSKQFFELRRRAAFDRVAELLDQHELPLENVTARLLTQNTSQGLDWRSPHTRLIAESYRKVMGALMLRRLARPLALADPPLFTVDQIYISPLPEYGAAAVGTGFVDYRSPDGVARWQPLLLGQGNHAYPQLGLAMACRMLDVAPGNVQFTESDVTLKTPAGRQVVIPVQTRVSTASGAAIPTIMLIPWFGNTSWKTMYDWPNHVDIKKHLSFNKVWDICATRQKVRENNVNLDDAIPWAYDYVFQADERDNFKKLQLSPDDWEGYSKAASQALLSMKDTLEQFADAKPEDLGAAEKRFVLAVDLIRNAVKQDVELGAQLGQLRSELSREISDRAVLIGWTATGAAADFIPTSLSPRCPGVVVHGAIFNAIMTNHFWRQAPSWIAPILTLLFGLLTAIAAAYLPPVRAMVAASLMLIGYVILNGVLLFDRFGIVAELAAPVVAIAVVWSGCVLMRIFIETKERAHLTRRFQAYVDPTLVNYVLEHPEKARLEGQIKELTVVFTDLANFTTLSEKLGEKSVTLLNDYMAVMVPIIRAHRGYVNKFLGDGIMCFYGAPADSKTHTADAVQTALDMQSAMVGFNQKLAEQGLPQLAVRAGISTGKMVVGDAGAADASDYTVLGDAVNLGSRLESANKFFGTRVMINARAAELVSKQFLLRPLGSLRVVGKTEGVNVFEPICAIDRATETQIKTAELTRSIVDAFGSRDFQHALAAIVSLEQHVGGASRFTGLYRELCGKYLAEPPAEDFNGTIALTEK